MKEVRQFRLLIGVACSYWRDPFFIICFLPWGNVCKANGPVDGRRRWRPSRRQRHPVR